MTFQEAIDKIVSRILETTGGWSTVQGECMTTMFTHDSLPGLVMQYEVDCPYGSRTEYAVRLKLSGETILLVKGDQTVLCYHVRSILEKAKEEKESRRTTSVIKFAEAL